MRLNPGNPRQKLDPARWGRLKDILADALEQPSAAARAEFVASRCADDAALLAEAASLVKEAERLIADPTDTIEECAEHATARLWHDEAPREGWRIGAYSVKRELGRGGMGTVYLAARADGQFEKEVAIKVLKRGMDTDEVLRRFAAERHILARLDHPNIARLLDAGTTDDGLPYFVMEYVAGAPVTRFVREHHLSVPQRLELFLKICTAVEVAHRNHVIHRDLKPTNILVNNDGEPKLLDFGIAKLLTPGDDWLELTAAGEQRLTPACASPEQADGRPMTEASDVYALGALLYEMLSGQKPHKFTSARPPREEIARVIREEEPVAPSIACESEVARNLRGNLDAIVLFALRKLPECRYPTVAEFAADIRRHLVHEPVLARKHSARYRAKCLVARHRPRRLFSTAVISLVLAIAVLLTFWNRQPAITRPRISDGTRTAVAPPNGPKSIAVLPFDNFGDDSSSSYFADGVQDNILTDLGKISDLKVISRSGVAAFRGKTRNVKEIGRQLGVTNVLEGSVQISGDRVRINAQLINTDSDTQVWAEHYDRKIEDLFALQSELAQTIAAQLNATLSSGEKAAIWKRPTEDMQAYDLYLRARETMDRAAGEPMANTTSTIALLEEAIARDPKFALAYCLLAESHLWIYRWGTDHTPQRLAAGKQAAEMALALEPTREEARVAYARYFYDGLGDYRRTQEELSLVPAVGAHAIDYHTLAGLVQRRLGLWPEALRNSEKAVELDPQSPQVAFNFVQNLAALRKFNDADRAVDRAIRQVPVSQTAALWRLKHEFELGRGDLAASAAALDAAPASAQHESDHQLARLWLLMVKRDFTAAKQFSRTVSEPVKATATYWNVMGSIARAAGDASEARTAFATARGLLASALEKRPGDAELLSGLAEVDAGLGRNDDAVNEGRRAVEISPIEADALRGPRCGTSLAQVLAWNGDMNGALDLLTKLAKLPFGPSYGDLKFNPVWDSLRIDSRFDQVLSEAAAPITTQLNSETPNSIAVLPFQTLSSDAGDSFFAAGVQDAILSALGKLSELKVISRNSVTDYALNPPRDVEQIRRQLNVQRILEGSVQKLGNKVQVTAKLINTTDGAQEWAETYQRDLTDVFEIQADLAQAIVAQLKVKLRPEETAEIKEPATHDTAAYEFFVQGKEIVEAHLNQEDVRAALLHAVDLFNEATKRDPNFTLAHCYAARAHNILYGTGLDSGPARRQLAENSFRTALRLDPNSAEAHLAAGDHFFRCYLDLARANTELELVEGRLPNSSPFYVLAGHVHRRLGRWQQAEREFSKAVELDPKNVNAVNYLADTQVLRRRFAEAISTYQHAATVGLDSPILRIRIGIIRFAATGEVGDLRVALEQAPAQLDVGGGETPLRVLLALIRHDYTAASDALAASPRVDFQDVDFSFYYPRAWYQAVIARAAGDRPKELTALAATRSALEERMKVAPLSRTRSVLAQVYAGLGMKDLALQEIQAVLNVPRANDAYERPLLLQAQAQIYLRTGDQESAVTSLKELMKAPGYLTYGYLKADPAWDSLRANPRFQELLASVAPNNP